MKTSHHSKNIVSQTICGVVAVRRSWFARRARAFPRYPVDVILVRKFLSETIERMRGISGARQKDERPPSPSPIKHFKLNAFRNAHKLNLVRR
jgi:hypothetical protein